MVNIKDLEEVKNIGSNDHLWWLRLVLGIAAVLFGISAVVWPGLTIITLIYLFSAFIIVWGLIEFITGLLYIGKRDSWWLLLLFGVIGIGIGVYLLRNPYVSFQTFILLAGLALITRGVFELAGSFINKRRDSVTEFALTIVTGVAATLAGVVLLFQPEADGINFVWIIGVFTLIMGAISIVQALTMYDRLNSADV
ncbi:MAG TPA: DUF308 domain-containing protein [Candidatus Saccharimonadales bacterium]